MIDEITRPAMTNRVPQTYDIRCGEQFRNVHRYLRSTLQQTMKNAFVLIY